MMEQRLCENELSDVSIVPNCVRLTTIYGTKGVIRSSVNGQREKRPVSRLPGNGFLATVMLAVILIWMPFSAVHAYNIDTEYPVVFKGPPKSYFGYSVAFLKNAQGSWVLSGAPRANSTKFPNVVQPGEIFKCHFQTQNCTILDLDPKGETVEYLGRERRYKDRKENGWLGVSLDTTSVREGRVAACAHKWSNQIFANHFLPNGICYTIDEDFEKDSLEKLLPLIGINDQILSNFEYKYAVAQGGISAHFVKDSDSLLLGAPGIYDWRGSGVLISRADTGIIMKRSTSLQNYANFLVPNPLAEVDYTAYFGYAVTSGKFDESGAIKYVFGAPRQAYRGMVYIVNMIQTEAGGRFDSNRVDIKGEQMGEYYGATLCAVDLNNDGLDDLLVGAPLHSKVMDEGKVYVLINKGSTRLQPSNDGIIGSQIVSARFGSSIAVLGDVNMDGYPDVAIGAPYENDKGAVYIYHGNVNGLKSHFQQKIEAKQAGISALGFGISIARGMDVDGNNYNDLLVGSYSSNEAYVFRSQPLIYLSANLSPDRYQLDTETKDCVMDGVAVSCFKLEACVTYTGKFVPKQLNVRITLEVDVLKGNETNAIRVLLKTSKNTRQPRDQIDVTLQVDKPWCNLYEVHAPIKPWDYMTSIQSRLTYEKLPEVAPPTPGFCSTCALIDQSEPNVKISQVRFTRDCGLDEKCDTDLQLKAEFEDYSSLDSTFVIGSTNKVTLSLDVFNAAEAAYATMALVDIPVWMDIDQKPPSCDFTIKDKHKLLCQLANPLGSQKNAFLKLALNLQRIPVENGFIVVNITARSDSNEDKLKLADNVVTLRLPVRVTADIFITGVAIDEQVFFAHDNQGNIKENTTTSFTHAYEITNKGPSTVSLVAINVRYPSTSLYTGVNFMQITLLDKRNGQRGAIFGSCEGELSATPTVETREESATLETVETDHGFSSRRKKRQADNGTWEDNDYLDSDGNTRDMRPLHDRYFVVNCSTAICQNIKCAVGPMAKDSSASLVITATVDINKLRSFSNKDSAKIYTEALAVIMLPNMANIQPPNHLTDYAQVSTDVSPGGPPSPKEPAKWIIPVCVIGGLLLLVLITTALVKAGFFRRKEQEEMQKLKEEENDNNSLVNNSSQPPSPQAS